MCETLLRTKQNIIMMKFYTKRFDTSYPMDIDEWITDMQTSPERGTYNIRIEGYVCDNGYITITISRWEVKETNVKDIK